MLSLVMVLINRQQSADKYKKIKRKVRFKKNCVDNAVPSEAARFSIN